MKLDPEDPRLTAYVLGELGPEDAATVERAVAEDPALLVEIGEIKKLRQTLITGLAHPPEKLSPQQHEAIRSQARPASPKPGSLSSLMESAKSWLIPAAAAAVLTIATVILLRMPAPEKKPLAHSTPQESPETANHPASGPPDTAPRQPAPLATNLEPTLPALSQRGSVSAAEYPVLDLPIQTGTASYDWISKSILTEQKLPPHNTVRLEEILNHFSIRLNGTASIARSSVNSWHPDQRGSGVNAHTATLTTEMIACPWKPSSTLLFVSLRGSGSGDKECQVKMAYQANPKNVARYRLLGFSPMEGKAPGTMPTGLKANSAITLAIEIEPSTPESDLGSLIWSTDDKSAPTISLLRKMDVEPSDDARFAALVCTYAQWLAGEQAAMIDDDILSALAREIASSKLPPDRAEFLNLIDRSLHL